MPKRKIETDVWKRKKKAIIRSYAKMENGKKGRHYPTERVNQFGNNQQTFFQRAMEEYERRKAYKEEKHKKFEAKQKEKEEAIKKYQQKKKLNFKKLSQKTKWGQPVMKGRMEVLLEKIEKTLISEKR